MVLVHNDNGDEFHIEVRVKDASRNLRVCQYCIAGIPTKQCRNQGGASDAYEPDADPG